MKNRITSIMDSSKKKAGIAIISLVLIFTVGAGMAFAATPAKPATTSASATSIGAKADGNVKSSDEAERLWLENLYKEAYARNEREMAELEAAFRASSVQIFAIYEQHGLTYNPDNDRLYYNGELVRYFEDNKKTEPGQFEGTTHPGADGNIDVHAVRNSAGELIGLELYSQAEYDARTQKMYSGNGDGNATVSGGDEAPNPNVSVNP